MLLVFKIVSAEVCTEPWLHCKTKASDVYSRNEFFLGLSKVIWTAGAAQRCELTFALIL